MSEQTIVQGDCLEVIKTLPSDSVDLLCTDPPYGYSFMGKDWDKAVPSVEIWKEALRVLKPGAFAFVMSAPRQDVLSQMIVRIGEAGFDTDFTSIYWTYASGFPKAANIGKMVDKRSGTKRKVVGANPNHRAISGVNYKGVYAGGNTGNPIVTKGTSPLEGSYGGFQPKPAVEVIIVAMKPLSEKTFVDQALKNGKGVTWLDDCRVPTQPADFEEYAAKRATRATRSKDIAFPIPSTPDVLETRGRFPANLLVENNVLHEHSRYFDLDKWFANVCKQFANYPFLICPKASKSEKNEGLEAAADKDTVTKTYGFNDEEGIRARGRNPENHSHKAKNNHPTVKPLKLMSYLITLGSRPGDTVLEPFAGSGTTVLAAKMLGRKCIGIELQQEYAEIARARLSQEMLF